uniref:LEM domain-containing protein n=1 Tax=Ciona savignyi TaxID=51511 RepID=H2Y9P2_CIOSA
MSQHQTAKNKGNVLINSQGNFSSDDDATSMNKSSNKRVKRKKKPVEPDTESISVHELTNDEIVAQLRSFGMNPGPVGPSTRNVYIKKLEKYMSKEQAVNNQEYSDKEEEIEVEQPTVVTRSSSRRKTAQLEIKSTRKRTTEHTTYNSSQPVHAHADESDEAEDPDHFAATQPANMSTAEEISIENSSLQNFPITVEPNVQDMSALVDTSMENSQIAVNTNVQIPVPCVNATKESETLVAKTFSRAHMLATPTTSAQKARLICSSATRRRPLRPRVNDQVKKTSEPIVATKAEEVHGGH